MLVCAFHHSPCLSATSKLLYNQNAYIQRARLSIGTRLILALRILSQMAILDAKENSDLKAKVDVHVKCCLNLLVVNNNARFSRIDRHMTGVHCGSGGQSINLGCQNRFRAAP